VNALARDDECRGARRLGAAAEKPERRDNQDDEREYRDQIDLSGVVPMVADFPAHCCALPTDTKPMHLFARGSRHGSNARFAWKQRSRAFSAFSGKKNPAGVRKCATSTFTH
jgi:hypothetical protein